MRNPDPDVVFVAIATGAIVAVAWALYLLPHAVPGLGPQ